jgi:hypothetical protein
MCLEYLSDFQQNDEGMITVSKVSEKDIQTKIKCFTPME